MDLGLQDKVAIITGGSDGIGKAAALSMANEGASVVIVARRQDVLDQARQEILAATEGQVTAISADVMEPDSARSIVEKTLNQYGRLDILVNNAGQSMAKPFEDVSQDDWEFDFELKVWGAVRLIQESIPEMRKVGGGRIINVTNLGGRTPGPASMPTSISRAAGIAITKGLSKDLAQRQYPGLHGLHRPHQERPAPAPLRRPRPVRTRPQHGRLLRPVGLRAGAAGPGRRTGRGRRRHRLPRLGTRQLPDRHRRQPGRRRVRGGVNPLSFR